MINKKTKEPAVAIKRDEKTPESLELIASAVIEIADSFKKIQDSRLNKRAILVLIRDKTDLTLKQIELVLDCAANLKNYYIKK